MLIEGYASTPHRDSAYDVVLPSAFETSIREHGLSGPEGIRLLAQHDKRQPIGAIHKLEIRNEGLWMEAEIDETISYAADLAAAIRAAGGLSYSIGYRLGENDVEFVDKGPDSYFRVHNLDLFEVSVVTFPCNRYCHMLFPKSATEKLAADMAKLKQAFAPSNPYSDMSDQLRRLRQTLST